MNNPKQSKALVKTSIAVVFATVMISGLASSLWSAESKSEVTPSKTDSSKSKTNSVAAAAASAGAKPAAVPRHLTGAELYSMHCNRCHPERYPTERTAAQWKTIMLHMQVRANVPPAQAKLILKYLQENSGR
jgi:hypothetical protein